MNAELRLREAEPADAAAIAAANVTSWDETYAALLPPEQLATNTIERRVAYWDGILHEAERDVFVALAGGVVVGFVSGGAMPGEIHGRGPVPDHDAYVDRLYVVSAWHGRGIGRALLGTLAQRLAQRGFRALALHVVGTNPARHFYERLGARLLFAETFTDGPEEEGHLVYGWSDIRNVPTGALSVDGSTSGR